MNLDALTPYWAPVIASVIGVGVILFVAWRLYQQSARGRLHAATATLRRRERDADKVARRVAKAESELDRLRRRADSVKPRRLSEVESELADALALQKIRDDLVLVGQNQLRQIIVEEFPPQRQKALRERYLRPPDDKTRPFSF